MNWKVRSDLCKVPAFWGSIFLLIISVLFAVLCFVGIDKVPRCRYGEPECYFVRDQIAGESDNLLDPIYKGKAFKNHAVEGDSSSSLEQLALPFFVTCASLIPPVQIFVGVLFGYTPKTMELGKLFLTATSTATILSIHIVEYLTFDCRWWRNTKQDTCKEAMGIFTAGAICISVTQILLLFLSIYHTEQAEKHEEELNLMLKFEPRVEVSVDGAYEVDPELQDTLGVPTTPTMGTLSSQSPKTTLSPMGATEAVKSPAELADAAAEGSIAKDLSVEGGMSVEEEQAVNSVAAEASGSADIAAEASGSADIAAEASGSVDVSAEASASIDYPSSTPSANVHVS